MRAVRIFYENWAVLCANRAIVRFSVWNNICFYYVLRFFGIYVSIIYVYRALLLLQYFEKFLLIYEFDCYFSNICTFCTVHCFCNNPTFNIILYTDAAPTLELRMLDVKFVDHVDEKCKNETIHNLLKNKWNFLQHFQEKDNFSISKRKEMAPLVSITIHLFKWVIFLNIYYMLYSKCSTHRRFCTTLIICVMNTFSESFHKI